MDIKANDDEGRGTVVKNVKKLMRKTMGIILCAALALGCILVSRILNNCYIKQMPLPLR